MNDTYLLSLTQLHAGIIRMAIVCLTQYPNIAPRTGFNKHDMLIVLMIFFVRDCTPDDGNFHHSHFEKRVPFVTFHIASALFSENRIKIN